MKLLFDVEIPLDRHFGDTTDVSIFDNNKTVISVCTPLGGGDMSADEVKLLIAALKKAVELVESGAL